MIFDSIFCVVLCDRLTDVQLCSVKQCNGHSDIFKKVLQDTQFTAFNYLNICIYLCCTPTVFENIDYLCGSKISQQPKLQMILKPLSTYIILWSTLMHLLFKQIIPIIFFCGNKLEHFLAPRIRHFGYKSYSLIIIITAKSYIMSYYYL